MRALVVDSEAPERIALHDVADIEAGSGEVLVEVRAISLNRGELRAIGGAADGVRPGWDFAGIVRLDGREGPATGTRVVGVRNGQAWAELVAVPGDDLAILPDEVTFAQAAALPTAGLTALRILRSGPGTLGRRVLITGASGGVGRFAVQLARLGGAEVTALVGHADRAAGVRDLGAHVVVSDVGELQGRFDLIVESLGGSTLGRLAAMLEPCGVLVMFGNTSGEMTTFDVRDVYNQGRARLEAFQIFRGGAPYGHDLAYLVRLVAEGRLDPQVAEVMPWEDMPAALQRLRARGAGGKLVLTVGGSAA